MLLFSLSLTVQASAKSSHKVKVFVNGSLVVYDVQPQIVNNRVLVPIRKTMDYLNTDVLWSKKEQKVTVYNYHHKVELFVNKKNVIVNGRSQTVDVAPVIYQSRILLPLRYLSELFGFDIDWDQRKKEVQLNLIHSDSLYIPVLMYHHFSETKSSSTTIHPDEFRRQLTYLKSIGYETITDHELLAYMNGDGKLPDKPILITMDDGYESNYQYAYPILKELGMKATIYVIGSQLRENNLTPRPPKEIPRLSWEQAREMYRSGVMEIQSHTYDLHYKGHINGNKKRAAIRGPIIINGHLETNAEYEKRVESDLRKNKLLIEEKVGNTVVSLAYPYGAFSDKSEKLVKKAGYHMSFSIKEGLNIKEAGPFLLHRINIPNKTTGQAIEKQIKHYQFE